MTTFFKIVGRDLRLALRQGADWSMIIAFFVMTIALFPLSIGPETNILSRIAPGVVLISALLASLLSLDRLFQTDYEDGSLELMILSPLPLSFIVLAKILAHWLTTGLPLIIIAPLLAVFLHIPVHMIGMLVIVMALITPLLSLIGAIGAALVLGARRGGVLIALLVLPLYAPILIFAAGTIDSGSQGFDIAPLISILAGLFMAGLVLAPFCTAIALRQSIE